MYRDFEGDLRTFEITYRLKVTLENRFLMRVNVNDSFLYSNT